MYKLSAPLNHLLKKDVKWNWMDECKKALKKLKTALIPNLALTHYNPNKQIFVACDASNSGLRQLYFTKKMVNENQFNMYQGCYSRQK